MPAKPNILVIDDEPGIRDLFTFLLEPEGFAIATADNGLAGVELAKANPYDLIFLDVHMPVMAGPEALRRIKELRPEQTVIVFSSSSDPQFIFETEAKNLGAFECIYKPFVIEEILALIRKALADKISHGS